MKKLPDIKTDPDTEPFFFNYFYAMAKIKV